MKNIALFGKTTCYLSIAIVILLLFGIRLQGQTKWELKADKNGIKVFTRDQAETSLKAVRATFEVDATLSQYASIILNVEAYKEWNYAATNPYLVKRINESELMYYTEAKAPWPVTDRYVVLHLKIKQDPESKILQITLQDVPDQIPAKSGLVRIPEFYSKITVTPITAERVKVEYFLSVDPGGSIPAWVANLVSTKMPITTFTNLINRIKAQGGQRSSVAFVNDK